MSEVNKDLAETGAEYLLHIEDMFKRNRYGIREALQKASESGRRRGKIEGMAEAQEILRRKP